MNFKENESTTKLRGGYYTDSEIARFLLKWVIHNRPRDILEPSCGDGVFLRALDNLDTSSIKSVVGFEIEPSEAAKARIVSSTLRNIHFEILSRDFLGWSLLQLFKSPMFDAVVGNPPYVRYQYLDAGLQAISEKIFEYFHLPFTKHTNAWVPFVISSIALLRPGGRLAMVVPAELLHVLHAQSLRLFLTQQCSRVLIFDPQELLFNNALQGAILLLAEKKASSASVFQGVSIVPTHTKSFLSEDPDTYFSRARYTNGETVKGKWMLALLTDSERQVLKKAKLKQGVYSFGDIAEVAVGIVTGANNFFLVPDSVIKEFKLRRWAYPMFGRSEHVPGVVYDDSIQEHNREIGLPTNFIWFRDERLAELPLEVRKYIKAGEAEGLHKRYKCRIRAPWYSVPSVYSTSVGMLKRCHDFPRLILNKIQAFTTDTAYRIRYREVDSSTLVFSFVNSLTALTAELEGRHYGGGVLELVPSEIRKLLVPIYQVREEMVYQLDHSMRMNDDVDAFMANQDKLILKEVGFTQQESEVLINAWIRLRSRRQRHPNDSGEGSEATEG